MTSIQDATGKAPTARDAILHSIAEEFAEKGYGGVSFGSVATRSGKSKALVQYHFPSKLAMATALVESTFGGGAFMRAELPVPLRGVAAILASSEFLAQSITDSVVARGTMRLLDEVNPVSESLPTPYVGWVAQVDNWLEQAKADGEVRPDIDCAEEAWFLVAAAFGVEHVCIRLGELEALPGRAEKLVRSQLRMLGAVT